MRFFLYVDKGNIKIESNIYSICKYIFFRINFVRIVIILELCYNKICFVFYEFFLIYVNYEVYVWVCIDESVYICDCVWKRVCVCMSVYKWIYLIRKLR